MSPTTNLLLSRFLGKMRTPEAGNMFFYSLSTGMEHHYQKGMETPESVMPYGL